MLDHLSQALLYESGEMDTSQKENFARHLNVCFECRALLDLARRSHRWSLRAQEAPAPELFAAVLAPPKRRALTMGILRYTLTSACAAVCAVAAVVLILSDRPKPSLGWDSDLPQRIWKLQEGIEKTQAVLRTHENEWREIP